MKVAVFGCLHGQLDDMFKAVTSYETENDTKVDLIVVCGDCQTIRHQDDLRCLAVPNKYKRLGDFHEYYSGKKQVPRLTIFVGGNHEASNYLMTLPYGGWVCDNFYYLGFAGVIKYKGLRIAGISGIYNSKDCNRGRFEKLPLDDQSLRSIYHTRRLDAFRLSLLDGSKNRLDVVMSHDWPARIYEHGDVEQLLRFKPYFRQDIESRYGLGSPLTKQVLDKLKPQRWFAAHMHCRFEATVKHTACDDETTKFLSLNKIENGKNFVEFLDLTPIRIDSSEALEETTSNNDDNELYYDEEWLTILRKTIDLEYKSSNNVPCPPINADDESFTKYLPNEGEVAETREMMEKSGGLQIKRNFRMSEPVIYNREGDSPVSIDRNRTEYFPNPQHIDLCSRIGVVDKLAGSLSSTDATDRGRADNHSKQDDSSHRDRGGDRRHNRNFDRHDRRQNNHYAHPHSQARRFPNHYDEEHRNKKHALALDEDGCLPFIIDKRGEPKQ